MSSARTILVVFGESQAAPEVCYSLIDGGFDVMVACRKSKATPLRKSRLVVTRDVTSPEKDYQQTTREVLELARNSGAAAVLPLDDTALWLVNKARDQFGCPVATSPPHAVEVALDKRLQIDAAREAGFSIPKTSYPVSTEEVVQWNTFPCIIKGAFAARPEGNAIGRSRAHFCRDDVAIKEVQADIDLNDPVVLQEWKNGVGVGVFGFRTDSGVHAWSAHHRIRMMNPAGSGSSCCESELPSPETRKRVESMLESIGWRGLFMIELLRDAQCTEWFMELNGRAWGSMALARALGMEYPLWAVQDVLGELPVLPECAQETPRRARNLGRELVHLMFVLRGRGRHKGMEWPTRLRTIRNLCGSREGDRWYNARRGDMKVFLLGCDTEHSRPGI